jgi:hypothetical protein
MPKTPSIKLGAVSFPEMRDAGLRPDHASDDVLRAQVKATQRRALADFTTEALKDELLARNCTDFSRVTPWLKCALLLVILALIFMTHIGMRCQDGDLFGIACNIAQ